MTPLPLAPIFPVMPKVKRVRHYVSFTTTEEERLYRLFAEIQKAMPAIAWSAFLGFCAVRGADLVEKDFRGESD